jgi:hypothetical protein
MRTVVVCDISAQDRIFVGNLPLVVVVENVRLVFVFYLSWYHLLLRAFPHSRAQPAEFRATTRVMRLALSGPSIRRKRHESAISLVMESGPKL